MESFVWIVLEVKDNETHKNVLNQILKEGIDK